MSKTIDYMPIEVLFICQDIFNLGFKLISADRYGFEFTRYDADFDYTHKVFVLHKYNNKYVIQSYDANKHCEDGTSACVSLTPTEAIKFGMLGETLEKEHNNDK